MTKVQVDDRKDDDTIFCKVSWDEPGTDNKVRLTVSIPATPDEFSLEEPHGELPARLKAMAKQEALRLARMFLDAEGEYSDA